MREPPARQKHSQFSCVNCFEIARACGHVPEVLPLEEIQRQDEAAVTGPRPSDFPIEELCERLDNRGLVFIQTEQSLKKAAYREWLRDDELKVGSEVPEAEVLRRAKGRAALRRKFSQVWARQPRELEEKVRAARYPVKLPEDVNPLGDVQPLLGMQRPRGRAPVVARLPGEDVRQLVPECVKIVDDWISHLAEQESAEAHVESLNPLSWAAQWDLGETIDPNHRALVTAAQCYDRLRKHARLHHRALHPTAPYHVLATLLAGHSARRGDTETLARQLKKLAERPCGTKKN
jgi:hypothetical protein